MGILISIVIIAAWLGHLYYSLLYVTVNFTSPLLYLHILLQGYLYTGLFITSHDAMHGTVSRNRHVNTVTGAIAAFLFAGMSYGRLKKNHFKHHNKPGTEDDPDFHTKSKNFWIWWLTFMYRYTTIMQIIVMGIAYNVLNIWVSEIKLWLLWIMPAFLGTLQLFYFGTYLPHKTPHHHEMEPHKARTQNKNHVWAMLSCYFFGYHYEHHEAPHVPWWKLYKVKK